MMPEILVVCPSPSFQRVMFFDKLVPGSVNRASKVQTLASGKGVNCSRAITRAGGAAMNLMFLGGSAGKEMTAVLRKEKFRSIIVPVSARTRTCVTVIHGDSTVTELVENAAKLSRADEDKFQQQLRKILPRASFVICGGSIPSGVSPLLYQQIARQAAKQKIRILVDAAGEVLLKTLRAKPWLVKLNHLELASTFHLRMAGKRWIEKGIAKAHRLGARQVIVTNSNVVYISDGRLIRLLQVPKVKVRNTVGAGDAFSGALAYQLTQGCNLFDSARFATACASSAVTTNGYGDFNPSLARMLKVY
jgi:1-phosphofructokinase family hexose kinase